MTRILVLCAACRARLVSLVAIAFAAHWILELIAVSAIAQIACN